MQNVMNESLPEGKEVAMTAIMQKDDAMSPWFVLQSAPVETAREIAWKLAEKRNKKGNQWPKWHARGIQY
jgi:hypothetical protein